MPILEPGAQGLYISVVISDRSGLTRRPADTRCPFPFLFHASICGKNAWYWFKELNVINSEHSKIVGNVCCSYAGEYVWAKCPNSFFASKASNGELAVVDLMYSRKIPKVFHKAKALNAKIISTSALRATSLITFRFLRSLLSCII